MGLIDKLIDKSVAKTVMWASNTLGTPTFMQFGDNIMNDETVATITNRILDEYSKLKPRHIRIVDGRQVKVNDNNINDVLQNPNQLMTQVDFIRKCAWLRETYKNCFIFPSYDLYYNPVTGQTKKVYKALYPLHPMKVDFYEDETGTIFIEFTFRNGKKSGKLRYDEIIHWRKEFGENEFMGGDRNGNANNSTLLKHLQTNDKMIQATFKSIEGSLKVNGVLKMVGIIGREKLEKERMEFQKNLEQNKDGFIVMDNGGDYVPIPYYGRNVSKDILKFFDDKIRRHYGVSEPIVDGKYTSEEKEAFYETVLESGVIGLGQAMERVLLTPFARKNGNTIICYTNEIQMMSADKKIQLATLLMPVAGVNANTVLSWFGEQPIENGDRYFQSLNWVPADIAEKYQLQLYKNDKGKDSVIASNSNQNNEKIVKNEE